MATIILDDDVLLSKASMCSLSKDLEMFSEYWKCSYLGSFQALKSVILMIWL